ncbi:MAG: sugar phosphate nucleotidyltransferase [Acetobacter sp.]|nr:sugar phosphate nucleotidyltransferase [Acetobacter sp.]
MFSRPEVAVLPVAGLSTRNLPATKAMHKGFLCLNNLPIIQYAVDACAEAGVKEVIFIYSDETSRAMYENYFSANVELEERLLRQDKLELWEALKKTVPAGVKFSFACQTEPKGNGHAVLCAKEIIGNRDFMVMWVDDVYVCRGKGILSQLAEVYEKFGGIVENIIEFPKEQLSRYGVLTGARKEGNIVQATGVIEKPKIEQIESPYASMGPYILPNLILDILPEVKKGNNDEINLTDAINLAARKGTSLRGVLTVAERYDCGTNEELAKSNIRLSIRENKVLYEEAVKTIKQLDREL